MSSWYLSIWPDSSDTSWLARVLLLNYFSFVILMIFIYMAWFFRHIMTCTSVIIKFFVFKAFFIKRIEILPAPSANDIQTDSLNWQLEKHCVNGKCIYNLTKRALNTNYLLGGEGRSDSMLNSWFLTKIDMSDFPKIGLYSSLGHFFRKFAKQFLKRCLQSRFRPLRTQKWAPPLRKFLASWPPPLRSPRNTEKGGGR